MPARSQDYAAENRHLRRCVNDLLSVLTLPAVWIGYEPLKIVETLADTLVSMLDLDFAYVRLYESYGEEPVDIVRAPHLPPDSTSSQVISNLVRDSVVASDNLAQRIPNPAGGDDLGVVTLHLGLRGEIGFVVAASQRASFPEDTEKLVLSVAANQTSIGLHEARLMLEQRRLAAELDHRVALRTEELAAINEELKREVLDRKRIEERLLESQSLLLKSEAKLRQALDTIPVIAWCNLPDGPNDFLNRVWREYTGLSEEASHGWGWQAAFHPQDLIALMERWQGMLVSGEPSEIEARIRRHDGVYRWFMIRAEPLRDEAGNPVRWYGTSTDIDDRKITEEKLLRSEAFLAEGQYLSRTGSFSWRIDTDEITWSEQLYRIFEVEPGTTATLELIGSRFHPEDAHILSEMIERVHGGISDLEFEHRLLLPDLSVKYLHLIAHANRDHEGRLEYIGAVQDVTPRRMSEEALANARTELAKVARMTSLGMLTASMAHEVNQPLSGIMTNASTCLRMLSADPPNVEGARETARRTIRDGNRASDVITRLRTLYSKKEPSLESMDLNTAAREVVSLSLAELQRNRVNLRQELADDLPMVSGDRIQLQQVILNLLRNGADAMSGVSDRPRDLLITTERHDGNQVRLSVKDAGIGFAPQAADRLFQAFYTTKDDGMGIGLSISRSIIEAHQGRLWATPNDGPGATFAFVLPGRPESSTGTDADEPMKSATDAA